MSSGLLSKFNKHLTLTLMVKGRSVFFALVKKLYFLQETSPCRMKTTASRNIMSPDIFAGGNILI